MTWSVVGGDGEGRDGKTAVEVYGYVEGDYCWY